MFAPPEVNNKGKLPPTYNANCWLARSNEIVVSAANRIDGCDANVTPRSNPKLASPIVCDANRGLPAVVKFWLNVFVSVAPLNDNKAPLELLMVVDCNVPILLVESNVEIKGDTLKLVHEAVPLLVKDVQLIAPHVKLCVPQDIVPEDSIDVDLIAPQVILLVPHVIVPEENIDVDVRAPENIDPHETLCVPANIAPVDTKPADCIAPFDVSVIKTGEAVVRISWLTLLS